MTKRCPRCKQDLPRGDFGVSRTRKDGLCAYCKPCQRAYRNEHYRRNSQAYKDRAVAARKSLRQVVRQAKGVPCMDCGISYPYYVMDLDHRPGEEKLFDPSRAPNVGSLRVLLAEIAKCDPVCANCHRIRTQSRLTAEVV